jgi:DNA helicase-2/ATP-dependent DNA helicase PcrA
MDGIGPSTARRITDHAAAHRGCPASLAEIRPPKAAAPLWPGFCRLLEDLAASPPLPVAGQVERVRRFYDPLLERRYENPRIRARDLESLEQIASGYASRSQFLAELLLDPPSATSDLAGNPTKDDDWLVLSTIHSAKGCEWDVVYLIHASDGCLPADMATDTPEAIEEERRLAYVAITRARETLAMTMARKRRQFGETINCEPSRFIEELPQEDLQWQGADVDDEQANEERGQETLAGLMDLFA